MNNQERSAARAVTLVFVFLAIVLWFALSSCSQREPERSTIPCASPTPTQTPRSGNWKEVKIKPERKPKERE